MSRPPLSPGARATLAAQAQMPSPPLEQMSAPEARASFDAGWPALQLPPDVPSITYTLCCNMVVAPRCA